MNLPFVSRLGCLGLLLVATMVCAKPKQKAGSGSEPPESKTPKPDISAGILAGDSLAVQRLERALDEPTEVEFIQASLTDVIDFLRNRHQVEFQIDQRALEEAGVAVDTCITCTMKNVSMRSALELMLRNLELTYVIRNEVLLITTVSNAETILLTKIYPIADLLRSRGAPVDSQAVAEGLIEVVTTTVASTTWNQVGGHGVIKYWPGSESLVISQTSDVHRELRNLFVALRAASGVQPADGADQAESAPAERAG